MFAYYARELRARGWSVSFLALGAPHELPWAHDLDGEVTWSRVLPTCRGHTRRLWRAAQRLVRPPEYSIVRESGVEHALFEQLAAAPVDIVHALHPWLIGAARRAINRLPLEHRPALVGHIMDIVAVQALDKAQSQPSAWLHPLRLLAFARWAWREFNDYAAADVWLAHSQTDLEIARLFSPHVRPGVHSPIWFDAVEDLTSSLSVEQSARRHFLFIGNFSDKRTKEGFFWLSKYVFPILINRNINIKIYLVGARPEQAPQWKHFSSAVFCGAVTEKSDLFELYDHAIALVFPLLAGRYSRHVKVLTAFARGCPVVMTSRANWTLGAQHAEEAWIADTPEEFVEGMIQLSREPALMHRLAYGGFARLRAEYPDTGVVMRTLEQVYALAQIR
ncbi:MAG: glycosyltransferase [Thermoflexales bacterium]|nr:glycosyltransferase [Thermoflexales bacterium]